MPEAPSRPCANHCCGNVAVDGNRGYCDPCGRARQARRRVEEPWRAWYQTPRWQRLAAQVLREADHICQCEECKREDLTLDATVVDHIVPHRGNPDLFWARGNLQAMNKQHHDAKTGREVGARRW